jgi:amidophosphoribosyltransferase
MNSIKHDCGIVGIFSEKEINMPDALFYPLFALQHRGQESCGISYVKGQGHVTYKDLGMVGSVLSHYLNESHLSYVGIGHVRYSTTGKTRIENAQPISIRCNKGEISLAHNGNISNSHRLRAELFGGGSIFQTATDSELVLHLISRSRRSVFLDALKETLGRLEGAFNLLLIHNNRLVVVRDPHGFRPLVIGERDGMIVVCSETCALDILQIPNWREVRPGEILIIDENGLSSEIYANQRKKSHCVFELIYFARPDSKVFGYSVHTTRERMGEYLAKYDEQPGDIVISVPDSGNSAAFGYAHASQVPFEMGLARNHYTGRTFIQPTAYQREFGVRMKLHPIREIIHGKRITLIDDSLVRGTTSKIIVKLLKENGAQEVHLRLSAPEIRFPCFFGIDIPTTEELISCQMNPVEISRFIGADSVKFLQTDHLARCVDNRQDFCFACFTGHYPVKIKRDIQG